MDKILYGYKRNFFRARFNIMPWNRTYIKPKDCRIIGFYLGKKDQIFQITKTIKKRKNYI